MFNMHIHIYSYMQETGKYRDQNRGVLGQEGGAMTGKWHVELQQYG